MSRRFPAPALGPAGSRVRLTPEVSHHLLRVVLVPRGTPVVLFDGAGREADGVLVNGAGGVAVIELTTGPRPVRVPGTRLLIAGLPRKPAWERTLRMATELGVTGIRGFVARHSVARGLHSERWTRIVEAAAGQCGRGDVPLVSAHTGLAGALDDLPTAARYVLRPGSPPLPREAPRDVVLLVGPEGGLHEAEVEAALSTGFRAAGLGEWVLRSDTAAVAALARLL